MINNIHIDNNPIGTQANQHYTLYAFAGTEKNRHQYYGLVWATNPDHAKDIVAREHFQIDQESLLIWHWDKADGTPGWGVVSIDFANALLEADA